MSYKIWECLICGFIYDEGKGWPKDGIAPGTRWDDVPEDWECPDCGVGKSDFEMAGVSRVAVAVSDALSVKADPLVIIGTGLAGYHVAREFRKHDQSTPLIMITTDDGNYYSKPMLSTGYVKSKQPEQLVNATTAQMVNELNADIRTYTRVTDIDATGHTLQAGDNQIAFSKLVLASGAQSVQAPITGSGLSRIYTINDLQDYHRFRMAMSGKKKALIIGAGLIGSEYANDMILSGFEINVVEPMSTVLATLLPPQASTVVQQSLEQAGVHYHFGTTVEKVDERDDGVRATLNDGSVIDADIVLSAIGVRPDLQLAELAGLKTHRGIITNRSLQTSAADIYALGDCAEVDGNLLYFVAPLVACARVLGKVLNGKQEEVEYGVMPVIVKTTVCPVVVSPPPRDSDGKWHVKVDSMNVQAKFITPEGRLLGFALTGKATKEKGELSVETQPLMN